MTLEQMREFVVLAEERNFLVAADMLYTTQTTLSRHIMAMEKELGFLLFHRSTKKIELTQEGSRFLVYARRAMKLQDEYLTELEWAKRSMTDSLNIGYNALITFYHFTDRLTRFMTAMPKIPIKIVEDEPERLYRAVQVGTCDIAFFQEDPFHPIEELDKVYIATDTLCAVLPTAHPLAGKKTIELQELKEEDFAIGFEERPPASVFIEACRHAGFEPRIARNGLVGPALFSWIGGSSCVGLEWSSPSKSHQDERTAVLPISPTVRSYTAMVYDRSRLSNAGQKLVEFFRAEALAGRYEDEI